MGKITKKIKADNERGARQSLIEELFYDFHRSRRQVYWMNFVRGIFFGAGTAIGGTLLIALLIWILTILGNNTPFIGDYIDWIVNALKR